MLNCIALTKTPELKKDISTVEVAQVIPQRRQHFYVGGGDSLPRGYILRETGNLDQGEAVSAS